MKVKNKLLEKSFNYKNNHNDNSLIECILSFNEIDRYLANIGEWFHFDAGELFAQELKEGMSLATWLFDITCENGEKEYRDFLMNTLTKPSSKEETTFTEIEICFYPDGMSVSSKDQYVNKRRQILTHISDKDNFYIFMQSCFIDSIFSIDVRSGLNSITNFHTDTMVEIVKNLSVLNDEALCVYKRHKSNLLMAYKELTSKLLECSPDSKNAKHLKFDFIDDNGKKILIECSPHTKLIRKDSNLRIYFFWSHKNIGGGGKVLIGRIGSHPY